jgi:hypothetical protein
MDINNPTRDEPIHNKSIAKVIEYTNQETPSQGDSCTFPFFGNVGAPYMATLIIPRLNVGLPVCFWTNMNVLNALDASQISTLCQGNYMDVDPLPSTSVNSTPSPSPPSGEGLATSNKNYKSNRKRKSNKTNVTNLYESCWRRVTILC